MLGKFALDAPQICVGFEQTSRLLSGKMDAAIIVHVASRSRFAVDLPYFELSITRRIRASDTHSLPAFKSCVSVK